MDWPADTRAVLALYAAMIEQTARRIGVSDALWSAEDLVAEGMYAAACAYRSHDPARGGLSARVKVAVRHRMMTVTRRARRERGAWAAADAEAVEPGPSPEHVASARQFVARLHDRDARIARRALAGCTGAEIGEALGVSRERVRQLLERIERRAA